MSADLNKMLVLDRLAGALLAAGLDNDHAGVGAVVEALAGLEGADAADLAGALVGAMRAVSGADLRVLRADLLELARVAALLEADDDGGDR
ncbi:hypothetical protein GOHSU_68_00110 [Gordonia hirsuta DSM 44140 = NBRC 16056]|uniref:Uncharacterized protein n=1 Tax=Gordonia hirsuta DSM 44140 = NBRC 16056 TaxID=1121927 RepID=L7LDR4_9ACTN|nr:hypothetical protein [Gordonia hirsuta]GAC59019.1 hypothetical protein GOHSU_68_00110 [Gordonia hirsuta DSM 44140 = NBRC 16056]